MVWSPQDVFKDRKEESTFQHVSLVCMHLLAPQFCDSMGRIGCTRLQKTWVLMLFIIWQGFLGIIQMVVFINYKILHAYLELPGLNMRQM